MTSDLIAINENTTIQLDCVCSRLKKLIRRLLQRQEDEI